MERLKTVNRKYIGVSIGLILLVIIAVIVMPKAPPTVPVNVSFVKVPPSIGLYEQPVITVVIQNPTGNNLTQTYTLTIDGKDIETKSCAIPAQKTVSCWFEPPPYTEPGTHEVKIAGTTQSFTVTNDITTVYERYQNKIWLNWHDTKPLSLSDLEKMMTPELKEKIKAMNLTWAYTAHDIGDYWNIIATKVIQKMGEEYNMRMLTIADAKWDPEKEIRNVEQIITLKPDILFAMPTDFNATANAYKDAENAGIRVEFTDDRPPGFDWPKDYAGVDTLDYPGYQLLALEQMANMLRKSTLQAPYEAIQFYFGYYFLPVTSRDQISELFIKERSQEFTMIAREGFTDPSQEVLQKTETLLTAHPNVNAIITPWSIPGMSAIRSAMALGKTNIVHATSDIGDEIVLEMARPGPPYVPLGIASFFEQAKIKFYIGLLDAAGVKLSGPVVMGRPIKVTRDNLLELYVNEWAVPLGKTVPAEMIEWLKQDKPLP